MAASDHLGPQFSAPYDLPQHYASRAIPTMDLREASSKYGSDEKGPETAEMRRYGEAMGRLKKANYPGL